MNPLRILVFIRKHKLTKDDFCRLCSISVTMLDDIIYYGKIVDFKVSEKIADAMGIGVYELFSFD